MDISENALELLQKLHEEDVAVSVIEKRTKWVRGAFEQATQELLGKGLLDGQGKLTMAGREKVCGSVRKQNFNVDMNAFNTKWG